MPEITTLDDLTKAPHAEIFEERHSRAVHLQLDAGDRVPPHTHHGTNIVLHLVSGHLELSLDGGTYDVKPGQLVRCSGECEISPHALEPSTAVVVFAPKADRSE
ncbi:cupin domain-containing protein [Halomarina litorea]|uniref:cupin domain-containing protein n=1 Tax=Halomarina litorea TaxID=2961595 RepID=UPI0020C4BF45|nr:cupin domain-containing protein [Halomarina sp. BCD28]